MTLKILYLLKSQRSLEHLSSRRQKDSNYSCQPMEPRTWFIRHRVERLSVGNLELPNTAKTQPNLDGKPLALNSRHDYTVIDSPRQLLQRQIRGDSLKMNLPDHRSVLTDQEVQAKMEMETLRSSRVDSPPNAHS
ncbi:hypothetical protein Tco_0638559 [Tanacetum coccineum]